MATVNLVNVSKMHGTQTILSDINLKIEKGEFIVVVGPSGCGKSTLLRLVAGLDNVTAGKILINNQCVNSIAPKKRDIAMVFQNYALYPHMTVYDNMAYSLKMRGMKKSLIQERVLEIANLLHLSEYLNRKPIALSGGQRQRVAMGRAIVRSPAVFLFDEPLSNLDAKLRTQMRHEIKKLHQELHNTSLYVTHDQTEAMTLANKVVILNNGKVEQIDTPQKIYQQPATLFVAGFTGHYPVNLLEGKIDLTQKKILTPINLDFDLPEKLNREVHCGEEVIIAIRPEHLALIPHTPNTLPFYIDYIDDMGADRLIYLKSQDDNFNFTVRISTDITVLPNSIWSLAFSNFKANIFAKNTGLRLGGWCEESS